MPVSDINNKQKLTTLTQVPESAVPTILAEILAHAEKDRLVVHIARNDHRMEEILEALSFFTKDTEILVFPAWDTEPYDRISPKPQLQSQRVDTLFTLASSYGTRKNCIVLTTVNAILQRVPPLSVFKGVCFQALKGATINRDDLISFLIDHGYTRRDTALDPGEFAIRGSIIDICPTGKDHGLRLDFFGDTLDCIRPYDPLTQISRGEIEEILFKPASEIPSTTKATTLFTSGYRKLAGSQHRLDDPLFEAVSNGRKYPGMEHWLPLYFDTELVTLLDYIEKPLLVFDHLIPEAIAERFDAIDDHFDARLEMLDQKLADTPYHPVPKASLFLDVDSWRKMIAHYPVVQCETFDLPTHNSDRYGQLISSGYTTIPSFSTIAKTSNKHSFECLKDYLIEERSKPTKESFRSFIACYSDGAKDRMRQMLADHDIHSVSLSHHEEIKSLSPKSIGLAVLRLEQGYRGKGVFCITEQDLLGERIIRKPLRKRRIENFLAEASSLTQGELVVHQDHGIGCFEGLETLTISGAKHDCILIRYEGGDKLYLPIENIDLIHRYGSLGDGVKLDKLGGAAWQSRKAGLKKRIKMAAEALIGVAAERATKIAPELLPPLPLIEEFASRFPYPETEDQTRSIEEVQDDLRSGKPMDRLICGDVGFGKTEVALRAAFLTVASEVDPIRYAEQMKMIGNIVKSGFQVAVVTPTTLLCRQHYQTFSKRFHGLPYGIAQLSRLVPEKEARRVKENLATGDVDIIIGTHSLLAKSIQFKNLALIIIDEEQHFGVKQKERLKELCKEVHVLTLTATPIPRTLQMSLTGIKELSLIATPPVDRLAVRTYVLPFDAVTIREAILREHYRGGKIFYVVPRISDLDDVKRKILKLVPEIKIATAHGQMPPEELDDVMNAFYDGKYDILLSTTIVESGLDIPSANTIIIHRADMFGLAQLYQLRGRVGRGKTRAYAYLTLEPKHIPTKDALKRLEVMQSLDSLGAGFTLASHDMDIRGFGNLLGEEQSGHIREVGIELYQEMLHEAVANIKQGRPDDDTEAHSSAHINLGLPVLIPESYVRDLGLRMGLYRRVASLTQAEEVESFAAELIDRFGPLPEEVGYLLAVVKYKQRCNTLGIDRLEIGPKATVLSFRHNRFSHPEELLAYIESHRHLVKIRPDQKLVIQETWISPLEKLAGVDRTLHWIETLTTS